MIPALVWVYWVLRLLILVLLTYKISLGRLRPRKSPVAFGLQKESRLFSLPLESSKHETSKPTVCIQLPMFNEEENAPYIIACAADLNWPEDKLSIQILDDSTDKTSLLVQQTIAKMRLKKPHLNISHLHRKNRDGFKAGALAQGMQMSQAEFFAIFDCDFRPKPEFLNELMPLFSNPLTAAVQARWSYANETKNLLTKLQRIMLNLHFSIEQQGRFLRGLFFNFNGTAGIWRGSAILSAGGWKSDTIIEDLMLSYRAQLAGWNLVYKDDVTCLSHLPENLSSFLVQQRRWAKGNGQALRIMSKELTAQIGIFNRISLDMILHLCGYGFVSLIAAAFFVTPIYLVSAQSWYQTISLTNGWRYFEAGIWSFGLFCFLYLFTQKRLYGDKSPSFWPRTLEALCLLFSTPLLAWLISGSFWSGLCKAPGNIHNLVFDRTPKGDPCPKKPALKNSWFDSLSFKLFQGISLCSAIFAGYFDMATGATYYGIQFFFFLFLESTFKKTIVVMQSPNKFTPQLYFRKLSNLLPVRGE